MKFYRKRNKKTRSVVDALNLQKKGGESTERSLAKVL